MGYSFLDSKRNSPKNYSIFNFFLKTTYKITMQLKLNFYYKFNRTAPIDTITIFTIKMDNRLLNNNKKTQIF